MKTRLHFTGVLFALCTMFAGTPQGYSAVLVGTQGSSFFSLTEFGAFTPFQPVADIVVGASDVTIGGFGVFGAAEAAGKIKWVLFEGDNLLWQSGTQLVSGTSTPATYLQNATWYDSPAINVTLQANTTYSMGLVANNMFAWGGNVEYDATYGPITANGLTIAANERLVQLDLTAEGDFAEGAPLRMNDAWYFPYIQTSVRIFNAGSGGVTPPIPEPAEWSMLLAGLLVVAFAANRQRRKPV